jgi:hypothetical protein
MTKMVDDKEGQGSRATKTKTKTKDSNEKGQRRWRQKKVQKREKVQDKGASTINQFALQTIVEEDAAIKTWAKTKTKDRDKDDNKGQWWQSGKQWTINKKQVLSTLQTSREGFNKSRAKRSRPRPRPWWRAKTRRDNGTWHDITTPSWVVTFSP